MSSSVNRDIVVIGGSTGAVRPLQALLGGLPANLPGSVFAMLHVPPRGAGMLSIVTAADGPLPILLAEEGMPIEPGHVYLAAPDRHLLLTPGRIRLGRGPRENMVRPAIDALFRSAAVAYGPRVIGVVLSGMLNDGAAGLEAIRRCGGGGVVQAPDDAIADEMPRAALRATAADLVAPAGLLANAVADMAREPAGWPVPVPPALRLEVDIAAGERADSDLMRRIADPIPITCPQCGGAMSQVRGSQPLRFRCQVGHAATAEILAGEHESRVDEALRVALRIIEERAELVSRLAEEAHLNGHPGIAASYEERMTEYRRHEEVIRQAVLASMPIPGLPA